MSKPKRKSRKQLVVSLYLSAIKNGFEAVDAMAHANAVMDDPLEAHEQREVMDTVDAITRELE
jgi:hypothetical protein